MTPLSRTINKPPTTVQSSLKRLADQGLIDVRKNKSRHLYEAKDPVALRHYLERQVEEVQAIVPLLRSLKEESSSHARVEVYYRERMADIFNEALNCKSKLVYEIVSAADLQKILGEKFHFTKRRIKNDIKLKSLRVESHEIKKYSKKTHERELREAKFLPREMNFQTSVMFWDNTVAIFSSKSEGLAIKVTSKSIRQMHKQIFDMIWSVSRRMETA